MTNLEALRRGMVGDGPRAGWRETIGARIAEVEAGQVVVELDAHAGHRHEGGVVQGGIITQIADAAMGMSLLTLQPDDQSNTTIELKINFVRPVVEGRMKAVGRVVELRRSLLFSEADVYDEQQRLVARASSTCLAIPRQGWRKAETG
ncbi:MAG: PaaI family thioesterase [Candidatus Dormibacteraeota bacterium]|nr:PaaI family thioesterase [Candidatus Dormibacteraeota bacterium]